MKTFGFTRFIRYGGSAFLGLLTAACGVGAWFNPNPRHPDAAAQGQPGAAVAIWAAGALLCAFYWRRANRYRIALYDDRVEAGIQGGKRIPFSEAISFKKYKNGSYVLRSSTTYIALDKSIAHLDDLVSELQKKVPLDGA